MYRPCFTRNESVIHAYIRADNFAAFRHYPAGHVTPVPDPFFERLGVESYCTYSFIVSTSTSTSSNFYFVVKCVTHHKS
ncbi:hypothetical protein VTL71DRAFT_13310 [Oculimacula yallundae]|uniref:Uncharacterized protein n=1 Tax=Oculimacula yallundae TaxID=86028 RepID=A0ABR4CJY6_9HELO